VKLSFQTFVKFVACTGNPLHVQVQFAVMLFDLDVVSSQCAFFFHRCNF